MDRRFTSDGNALSAVVQIMGGAKFRGVRFDAWNDGKSQTSYLHIVDDQGQTIGEADDYLYPIYGWSVRLFDGSYAGYVDKDQIEILE
ncbi:MAG: hypothetical protein WA183_19355 [Chthoniobacterales bacterium]